MICPRGRFLVCAAALVATTVHAQPGISRDTSSRPLFVGSAGEERSRLSDLGSGSGTLIRSASSSLNADSRARAGVRFGVIAGYGEVVWNSAIPYSMNDGALWAGRGTSALLGAGIWSSYRRWHVMIAPQLWLAENRSFALLPGGDRSRSGFGAPFLVGPLSADVPVRFGTERIAAWSAGESSLWLRATGADLGVSTESQWWGPGIRNALLVSNNAGGLPHAFLRTSRPVHTRLGSVEAKWMVGALSESPYFDRDGSNNLRAVSGAVVTLTPAREQNLTLGVARVVYSAMSDASSLPLRSLDVFLHSGRGATDSLEQLAEVFGRWRMPASHAEVYGEWGRMLLPASFRSFLQIPQFSQGFTVGAQWMPRISPASQLRFQLELTNLEQSVSSARADSISFYTSTTVSQGFTQRGQVVGAAIGPGSQSQWLAIDWLRGTRGLGLFLGRIRWNTDAYYTQTHSVSSASYDVSVFGGARASTQLYGRDVALEVTRQRRLNFLFQNALYGFSNSGAFDKQNITVRLRFY